VGLEARAFQAVRRCIKPLEATLSHASAATEIGEHLRYVLPNTSSV
jgi:hypothetical protein